MSNKAPFPIQPELTAIAIAYRNKRLIADLVLPRVPVGKKEFKYLKYNMGDQFTVPSTKVGRKTAPNMAETSATETPGLIDDCALEDFVPVDDVQNAAPGQNPIANSTEFLTSLIDLDREVRCAALVFDAAQYGASNKIALSGSDQWSDNIGSDPITQILTALDACIMRPNIMVIGRAAFTKLSTHKNIVQAVFRTSQNGGIVPAQAIADLFGLDEVLIGEALVNSAKKGQAPALARTWGKHAALLYRDSTAARVGGTTFGFTASFLGRQVYSWQDQETGSRGGTKIKVADSVKEVICANDLGYFIQNAVA
jgi:hypothetical protein